MFYVTQHPLRGRVGEHGNGTSQRRHAEPTDDLIARPAQQRPHAVRAADLGIVTAASVVIVVDGKAASSPGRAFADGAATSLGVVDGAVLRGGDAVGAMRAELVGSFAACAALCAMMSHATR